ncbi:type VI secretion system protein TssA [Pseudomonas mosselii]|uniref:type VI secretion system protein TssA n=1 Tax=Pseudomonas mosselii TaxID=78327 RepID=UPI0021D98670|nr:type VI secretion system protein TssA [Pseudomonas mosselii]MCU9531290.1 type VI secretion system protein TssA [Pseudomonas mosselii]MCU9538447.1 type VI secretion system protein TssA [Pseudomonas mosselii]MCU9544419.1 type VI secretion system protein TssA [Pseudomonas mosselii]MCU9548671.1 type VI secretion system protein TssA [Pseudomonas mosselii]
MSLVAPVSTEEVARLLAPVDSLAPAGYFDIEDETYQAIDQEMVKLGGLHEAAIDWPYIEEASRQYLSGQCKHLRIVGHLSVAWLRTGCWERWCCTLALLAGMVEHYWESAHPKPGPKGFLGKRKLIGLLLGRLSAALPGLDRFSYTPACKQAAQQALACLQQQAPLAQLDPAALGELERALLKQAEQAMGTAQTNRKESSPPQTPVAPLTDVFRPASTSISLGNERETRRAVLGMAEFINQQDIYDPTGYQLRRFGLWAHIQTLPSTRQGLRTELMAVPADIVGGYEDALSASALDPTLLMKVERSVAAAPYWIRGSYLAAGIATRLAMNEVAEAIRCATARFVRRLPALEQLCFSDGTAFVDDQCLAWLRGSQATLAGDGATRAFIGLREELASQLEVEGVEPVLLKLQGLQADYRSPRERCHSTVIAADLLASRGVSWLAQELCANVARTMRGMTAEAWEPEVYQQLQQFAATSGLNDQNRES